MNTNRREFVKMVSKAGAGLGFAIKTGSVLSESISTDGMDPKQLVEDKSYWKMIRNSFSHSPDIINLNSAGVSPQPLSVQKAMIDDYKFSNMIPTVNMWEKLDENRDTIRKKLAELADCSVDEVALNRNTTEGMCTVIHGIDLEPGDEVILSRWDYFSMRYAWQQREKREGIKLIWVDYDLPETHENIIEKYAEKITSRTRAIQLTQIIHYTGQIIPVKEICALTKGRDIHTVVDAAQTFAHIPASFRDLGCDYLATSLHKWLYAPFGSGMLIVKKNRISNLWPLLAAYNPEKQQDSIAKIDGWSLGTYSSAREQGIEDAVDFYNLIGASTKYNRLQYLKQYWTEEVKGIRNLEFKVSLDNSYSASLVTFSIKYKDSKSIVNDLRNEFGIHVVDRIYETVNAVRVTPNIFTSLSDLDQLIKGIHVIAKRAA